MTVHSLSVPYKTFCNVFHGTDVGSVEYPNVMVRFESTSAGICVTADGQGIVGAVFEHRIINRDLYVDIVGGRNLWRALVANDAEFVMRVNNGYVWNGFAYFVFEEYDDDCITHQHEIFVNGACVGTVNHSRHSLPTVKEFKDACLSIA